MEGLREMTELTGIASKAILKMTPLLEELRTRESLKKEQENDPEIDRLIKEIEEKKRENLNEIQILIIKWSDKINLDYLTRRKAFSKEDALDLKQEVLINIFERIQEYEPGRANFETWAWNRARQIIRSYIRKRIKDSHPIVKKGFRGDSIRAQIVSIPEKYDIPTSYNPRECLDNMRSVLVDNIGRNLEAMRIHKDKLEPTKKTLEMILDGYNLNEIAEKLETSKSQIRAHYGRIGKAYMMIGSKSL